MAIGHRRRPHALRPRPPSTPGGCPSLRGFGGGGAAAVLTELRRCRWESPSCPLGDLQSAECGILLSDLEEVTVQIWFGMNIERDLAYALQVKECHNYCSSGETRSYTEKKDYMNFRKFKYFRLDRSSTISDRRDMVRNFQNRNDIFVFLLSTRARGLGINLTAADTVIFYEIDWNPTKDQQAMDRTHRLGQTKEAKDRLKKRRAKAIKVDKEGDLMLEDLGHLTSFKSVTKQP